jgi:hypothetical protein
MARRTSGFVADSSPVLRTLAAAALLIPLAARAHAVSFDFITPSGTGNFPDGGFAVLSWQDGPDSTGSASFSLLASRAALNIFDLPSPDAGVKITFTDITVNDPVNVFVWNSNGVPAGCYQPYANMHDPVEGESYRMAPGNITVYAKGDNVPPAVWIDTNPSEVPGSNGQMIVRYRVSDPDDSSRVTLRWINTASKETGVIAADLPVPDGGGTGQFVFDVRCLAKNLSYYVTAQVVSADGRSCDAYWQSYFFQTGDYDGGPLPSRCDAGSGGGGGGSGSDAGGGAGGYAGGAGTGGGSGGGSGGGAPADSGSADAGVEPPLPKGCGCGAGPEATLLLFSAALLRRLSTRRS